MPVIHVYTAEGWLSPKRKRLLVQTITAAAVAAEGVPATRELTYVLVHEVPDGGWGWRGDVVPRAVYEPRRAPDPEE